MRISKVVSTIVIILLIVQGVFSQNYTKQISTGDYNLVWQDNFDGNTLDEKNNWNIEVNGNGGGNSELQYYRRENISVGPEPVSGANCLIITGKKENYLGKTCTSGRLTTQNKVTFQYGKLEARIKLPKTANGLWPAFWMLGTDIPTASW
ncbi:MAG: glycoside hydrolase family 16 protein, partial [Paludibacter sp.]